MKPLRLLVLALALLGAACDNGNAATPCAPACRSGETCTFGVCTVACNPPCGAGQSCVLMGGATACTGADGGVVRPDVATDITSDLTAPDDTAAPLDAGPDVTATPDTAVPADEPVVTDTSASADTTVPADTSVPADTTVPLDTSATPDVTAVDAAPDVRDASDVPDASSDVPARPLCGGRGQPCCGFMGSETACRDGLLCNAPTRGTCVDVSREPNECVTTATCTTGRVCGGPTGCAGRWCYRCQAPGPLPFEATCDESLGGATCVSGVCQRGRCTTACSLGAAGEDECGRVLAGSHCVAFYYGLELDGGTPSRWASLGYCVRGCARASDCSGGRACVASANLIDDRLDFVCQTTTRPGLAGSPCTSGSMCQSGLCINLSPTSSVCLAPCATSADCASPLVCRPISLIRPVTGVAYDARGCLPP